MADLPGPLLAYNTRALSKHSLTYELEKFEKRVLLIFKHENFSDDIPRLGIEKDVEELKKTFSSFNFEVIVENDLTKEEIMQKLKEFPVSDQDFTDYGCVAVAVLTHGVEYGQIRAKDQPYDEQEIINHFKVDTRPTLITKPKLFIIQACRDREENKDDTDKQPIDNIQTDSDEAEDPYTLPMESDMLLLQSSYIGKASVSDKLHGSWFIQSLCSKINQLAATQDLESIMTEVRRDVAIDINKQMPVTNTTLIRKLYFKRFEECVPSSLLYDQYGSFPCFF